MLTTPLRVWPLYIFKPFTLHYSWSLRFAKATCNSTLIWVISLGIQTSSLQRPNINLSTFQTMACSFLTSQEKKTNSSIVIWISSWGWRPIKILSILWSLKLAVLGLRFLTSNLCFWIEEETHSQSSSGQLSFQILKSLMAKWIWE